MLTKELGDLLDAIDREMGIDPPPVPIYECDCGRRFRHLEHLYQCQARNHQ